MTYGMSQDAGCGSGLHEAYHYIPKPLKTEKGKGNVRSPLPGQIIIFDIQEGQKIEKGQLIAVVEAMKMENEITAPFTGTVETVFCDKGDIIPAGKILTVIRGEEE